MGADDDDRRRVIMASDDVLDAAGLCSGCVHALLRPTRRGTTYLRCARAATDARFPKYPQLPVRECAGFEAARTEPD